MVTEAFGSYEVTSDGKIVWVNQERCIARFSQQAVEYFDQKDEMTGMKIVRAPQLTDWDEFKAAMKTRYSLSISDTHKPEWLP